MDFHSDLIPFFSSNYGGLNETSSDVGRPVSDPAHPKTIWTERDASRVDDWKLIDDDGG